MAKLICPEVQIIAFDNWLSRLLFTLFRSEFGQYYTYNPIYAHACCRWPHALYLFDMTFCRKNPVNISRYVDAFDPVLQESTPFSKPFLDTYIHVQRGYDYRRDIYQDMMKLTYNSPSRHAKPQNSELLRQLKIDGPYVVMNLNCKDYRHKLRNNRRINHPERYNPMIDFLISKGFTIVMQGRDEQPHLAPRKGYVEYFNSPFASEENDFRLFSQCSFAVFPKTGPEVFGPICNIPVLGLNYTELAAIVPKNRCRFYPKHVFDKKSGELIHWKELLKRPCFFDVGIMSFEEGIEYIDLEEEELMQATEEFLELLPLPAESWKSYTPKQREFKSMLHPVHIDLYDVMEVPCEAYLSSSKYK
ncbi:MAG: TIGR04372 family glycosyltransferase [Verrucomicrobia bacterium]|nr:TIGR04372 family glycosyltransferase [Verrucomicrobiota bacterium]